MSANRGSTYIPHVVVGHAAVHAAGGQVGSGFEDGILVRSLLLLLPLQGREQEQVS